MNPLSLNIEVFQKLKIDILRNKNKRRDFKKAKRRETRQRSPNEKKRMEKTTTHE